MLLAGHKTLLHNVNAAFPRDWIEASFLAAGTEDMLELQSSVVSQEELLERIAPGRRRR